MTREEAIEILHFQTFVVDFQTGKALEMAISALRQQDVPDTDIGKNAKWISVKDRLPEKSCRCLVFSKWSYGEAIETATYTPNYQGFEEHLQGKAIWYDYCSEYGDYEKSGITHWMPMPDKPEEGTV